MKFTKIDRSQGCGRKTPASQKKKKKKKEEVQNMGFCTMIKVPFSILCMEKDQSK
jgi:hypothetical protein